MNTQEIVSWEVVAPRHYPSLHPNMLTNEGEIKERRISVNGSPRQNHPVRFDRAYVKHYVRKKIVEALGFEKVTEIVDICTLND